MALAKQSFSCIMGHQDTTEADMAAFAIKALMGDWEGHAKAARAGDPRSSFAAWETLERLEELGVDSAWLERALADTPQAFTSWAINNEREDIDGQ